MRTPLRIFSFLRTSLSVHSHDTTEDLATFPGFRKVAFGLSQNWVPQPPPSQGPGLALRVEWRVVLMRSTKPCIVNNAQVSVIMYASIWTNTGPPLLPP